MIANLSQLGLDYKESVVYTTLLEMGHSSMLKLAQKCAIPRASLYLIMDRLQNKNLVCAVPKGKRTFYFAQNPEEILNQQLAKETQLREILPQLQSLYVKSVNRPEIKIYEGREGILKIMDDILASVSRGGIYSAIINAKDELPLLGDDYTRYQQMRLSKQITLKLICKSSKLTAEFFKYAERELLQIRFLPQNQSIPVSQYLYDNKTAIFSLKGPVVGMVIEDQDYFQTQSLQFEYMWQALKR